MVGSVNFNPRGPNTSKNPTTFRFCPIFVATTFETERPEPVVELQNAALQTVSVAADAPGAATNSIAAAPMVIAPARVTVFGMCFIGPTRRRSVLAVRRPDQHLSTGQP
ncbi:MAG: hypothetical protein ACRDSR_27225 [Pseudonocardiaceae bacterium]